MFRKFHWFSHPSASNRITDRYSSLVHCESEATTLKVSQCFHYPKDSESQMDANEGSHSTSQEILQLLC